MTLTAPNRETFKNAYHALTGVQLSDSFIGHFYKLAGMIGRSSIRTNQVVISWDGPNVKLATIGNN